MDGNALSVRDNLGENRVIAVRAWIQSWAHCGGRGMISERCVGLSTEMLFVRCTEERVY